MSNIAVGVVDALLVLNETILTVEQISDLVRRVKEGEVPTEEEIDEALDRNLDFAEQELRRIADER